MLKGLFKVIKILYWIANVVIILALLTIHFVLKERTYHDSLNYYAHPLPLIIVAVLVLSIFLSKRKYNLILAGILMLIWLGRSFKIHIPDTVTDTDMEVVFWNASRDNGIENAFTEAESLPDILVLVESKRNNLQAFKVKYPNYFLYQFKQEIYIFSKTEVTLESEVTSAYNTTIINFKTKGVNFYAVDVTGSTDVPRSWELNFVNNAITKTKNTIVLGDFNVPFESKYLNTLKTNYNHAFNKKGNGFRETWFWNLPILSLDHIWVSKDLKILKTQKINTFKSDHCMLKTVIKL